MALAMNLIQASAAPAATLRSAGVAYAGEIAAAARRHGLSPTLLAAVAAQETGGPGRNAGRNVVGDGGHGRGVFQIDDRWHAFARSPAAMEPSKNADYAAGMLSGLLARFGGNVREALSAYNAGDPHATGTRTTWADGSTLSYADSVLRHEAALRGGGPQGSGARELPGPSVPPGPLEQAVAERPAAVASIGTLSNFALNAPPAIPEPRRSQTQPSESYAALVDPDTDGGAPSL